MSVNQSGGLRMEIGVLYLSHAMLARGVSELMDGRGCAILALKVVPKNLIFA